MPRAAPIQQSFNAGEFAPSLEGRTDLSKYASACRLLENYLPKVQGPALKRSGTRFVMPSVAAGRLIPFEFNVEQAYILAFTATRMVVLMDGGAVLNGAQAINTISQAGVANVNLIGHGYATGDQVWIVGCTGMVEINSRYYTITKVDNNNFTLDGVNSTGYTAHDVGTGTVASVVALGAADIPYSFADLADLYYTQSADTLFICHPDHPPAAVTRTSHTAWSYDVITFDWPAFNPVQTSAVTMQITAGTILPGAGKTLTSVGAATFTADDVGRIIRLGVDQSPGKHPDHYKKWGAGSAAAAAHALVQYDGNVYRKNGGVGAMGPSPPRHRGYLQLVRDGASATAYHEWEYRHSGWGYVEITAFTDINNVTVTVIREIPEAANILNPAGPPGHSATTNWSWGAWDDVSGNPTSVTFHEDRLWWAGTNAKPQTFWGSKVGSYYDHEIWDEDDYALLVTINTDRVNAIEWMSAGQTLAMGTAGGEFIVKAPSADEPLSPGNIDLPRHATYGSRDAVQPVRVENVVLFAQRAGKKLREFVYDFDSDSYAAPDLSILAEHILYGQIKEMCFQQEPNRHLWVVLEDARLACLTYERAQEVVGWHRHVFGGSWTGGPGNLPGVLSAAVIPHPDGDQDQLWLMVIRTIDGTSKVFIEHLEKDWHRTNDAEDAFFCDAGITYDGAPSTVFRAADHLEGEAVDVLADGAVVPGKTITNGTLTLDEAASVVQCGLTYIAKLGTMRPEAGSATGTSQGKTKRINEVVLRLDQTGPGLRYGPVDNESSMEELSFRDSYDLMGEPVALFDGDTDPIPWPEGYERAARMVFHHYKPLPCTITAIMPQVNTEDD